MVICSKLGITVSPRSQKIMTYVTLIVFVRSFLYRCQCNFSFRSKNCSAIRFIVYKGIKGVSRLGKGKIAIVGGGLAGLMATIKAAEVGQQVELFSLVPVKRSHSVCAQGGINGAVNTKGEGDSPWIHFDDTVYGGDFLANQPPVKAMCEAAPGIINMFDRMGVMFNRTPEGLLDFRRFGGTQHSRTAFAGATTGQQLLYAIG